MLEETRGAGRGSPASTKCRRHLQHYRLYQPTMFHRHTGAEAATQAVSIQIVKPLGGDPVSYSTQGIKTQLHFCP